MTGILSLEVLRGDTSQDISQLIHLLCIDRHPGLNPDVKVAGNGADSRMRARLVLMLEDIKEKHR